MGELRTRDLSKHYGKRVVLEGLDFAAGPGVTVLLGPSGGGKSTLLRVLATLERPTSGAVLWNGADVARSRRAYRSALGYAPQSVSWPEALSAEEFLVHIGALKRIRRSDTIRQGRALLGRMGLERDATRPIRTFSGGMRRRLGLAQALLGAPEVLLLDEPAAELDPETSGHIHDLIFEQAARGAVVLMTTHREDAVEEALERTSGVAGVSRLRIG